MSNRIHPAIVVFPGSTNDRDMAYLLNKKFNVQSKMLWHEHKKIPDDISHIILPGGFSFGDHWRPGAIASLSPIIKSIKAFAGDGRPVMGVGNGFQILCEAKLLPGTLLRNHRDRFICQVVSALWQGISGQAPEPIELNLAIAHKDGRYFAHKRELEELEAHRQVVLRYKDLNQQGNAEINGALMGIAGIVSGPRKNIIGLMPHPQRIMPATPPNLSGEVILRDFLFGN